MGNPHHHRKFHNQQFAFAVLLELAPAHELFVLAGFEWLMAMLEQFALVEQVVFVVELGTVTLVECFALELR